MKIFDSSNPRIVASALLAVVSLTQNVSGTSDPLTVVSSNLTRLAPSVPTFGKLNVLTPSLTPNTITCSGVQIGDYVYVQGVKFTAVASGAVGAQFNQGGGDNPTATSLAAAISAYFITGPGAWFHTSDQTLAFGVQVTEPTGLVSVSVTGNIETSMDGVNSLAITGLPTPSFNNLSGVGTKGIMMAAIGGLPFVRANITGLTGTGAVVTVTMHGINSKST